MTTPPPADIEAIRKAIDWLKGEAIDRRWDADRNCTGDEQARKRDEAAHIDVIVNALSRPAARGGDDLWQPIETAPRDGKPFIGGWFIDDDFMQMECFWGIKSHTCGEMGEYCDSDWHDTKSGDQTPAFRCTIFEEQITPAFWHPMLAPPGKSPGVTQAASTQGAGGDDVPVSVAMRQAGGAHICKVAGLEWDCGAGFHTAELVFRAMCAQMQKEQATAERDGVEASEYRKLELLWKEACVAREDYKMQADAKDALWMGAIARAETAESALEAALAELVLTKQALEAAQVKVAGAYPIGTRVHKIKGYKFSGTVLGTFTKRDGSTTFVNVEHDDGWVMHFRVNEVIKSGVVVVEKDGGAL